MKSILRELDCFVCYESLKDPVYLHTCGHSLCLRCTKSLVDPDDLTITCPLDKRKTQFHLAPGGDVALPLNRPLMAINEAVMLHLKFCEMCQTQPVDFICSYDLLRLCSSCARRHRSSKHLRSHTVYGVGSQSICPEHNRKVLWFCFTERKLLCCECGDFGDQHKMCQVLPLSRARSRLSRSVKCLQTRCHELISEASELSESEEVPATLRRESAVLVSLHERLDIGPAAWAQVAQATSEITHSQKETTTALKRLRRKSKRVV